jgi:hypothetical protein
MNQHRSLTRLAAAAGAAALTMLALAPAASAVDPDAALGSDQQVYETYQQCPITQINGQLFRCDVATGGGVPAPAHVPQGSYSTDG